MSTLLVPNSRIFAPLSNFLNLFLACFDRRVICINHLSEWSNVMGSMSRDLETCACFEFPEEVVSHRSDEVHIVHKGSHHSLLTCSDTTEYGSHTLTRARARWISEAGPPVV